MLKVLNTLTKKKEDLIPLKKGKINLYACGVTVYDDCHIGHARSLYIFEVIRRYLTKSGFKVKFVRNITDIDDKIINRAKELNRNWKDLVENYMLTYQCTKLEALKACMVKYPDEHRQYIADANS